MHTIVIAPELATEQVAELRNLWNKEYPVKLAHNTVQDTSEYLGTLQHPTHYLLLSNTGILIGWAATFTRDSEQWFAIIIDSIYHKQGIGTTLLNRLKQDNEILNGWVADHNNDMKADGTIYVSPLAFYLKNGFTICEGVRLELEKLSAAKIRWVRS